MLSVLCLLVIVAWVACLGFVFSDLFRVYFVGGWVVYVWFGFRWLVCVLVCDCYGLFGFR